MGRSVAPRKPAKRDRGAFFNGYWFDEHGHRRDRIKRDELREIWRLWTQHQDIRLGRVASGSDSRVGVR